MSRYIDADKILYKDLSEGRGVCWVTFMDWIKEMPTADVRENVRGEWVYHTEPLAGLPYGHYTCSLCDKVSWDEPNFCPNCGAQMIGENHVDKSYNRDQFQVNG